MRAALQLPQWAADTVSTPPQSGEGFHNWLFLAARALWKCGRDESDIRAYLENAAANCGRHVTREEIADAVTNSKVAAWQPGQRGNATGCQPHRQKPDFDAAKLARIAAKLDGIDPAWFAARSSIRPDTRTPASFLHALYEQGEMVLVFDVYKSQGQHVWTCKQPPFDARELDSFRTGKEQGVWYLTNPIDGIYKPTGQKNPDGRDKVSRRTWQNVTSWRFMVVESDKADPAHWLAALAQMPLRIAAIYTSGGRSIHALVRLDAGSKAEWDDRCEAIQPALVTLGADAGALSAVRLSRLPGCERVEKGAFQTLYYLNPDPAETPICELPALNDPDGDAQRWATGEAFQ